MTSEEKIAANRRNAQLSTGPTTSDGKAKVSQNAMKHGMYSHQAVLPGESAKSPLIRFVARVVEDMEMPPVGKGEPLTPAQIGLLSGEIQADFEVWAYARGYIESGRQRAVSVHARHGEGLWAGRR